jgi:hypothetical protein
VIRLMVSACSVGQWEIACESSIGIGRPPTRGGCVSSLIRRCRTVRATGIWPLPVVRKTRRILTFYEAPGKAEKPPFRPANLPQNRSATLSWALLGLLDRKIKAFEERLNRALRHLPMDLNTNCRGGRQLFVHPLRRICY